MKKNLILFAMLGALVALGQPFTVNDPTMLNWTAVASGPPSPPPAPVMQFKMNDSSPASSLTESISGYNATSSGSLFSATDVNGNTTHAVQATGASQSISSHAPAASYPMTITCWVKTTDTSGDCVGGVFNSGSFGSYDCIQLSGSSWLALSYDSSFVAGYAAASHSVTDGNWHLLCAVFTSSTVRNTYTDGVLDGTESDGANVTPSGENQTAMFCKAYASPTANIIATLDDFRVYNYALNATQVSALYYPGHTTFINSPQ